MAKRKKTTHRRKRVHHMSEPGRRRKSTRRRSRGLGAMMNPTTAMAGARSIGAGVVGGLIATGVNKLVATQSTPMRVGVGVLASFLTYTVVGFPNMATGMAGAFTALEMKPTVDKMMGESSYTDYADASALNEMPIYLNESGEAIYLNDGGYSLADEYALAETSIYPEYATQY